MVQASQPPWLDAVLEKVTSAYSLERDECSGLVEGFVACNVVMDVAAFLRRMRRIRPSGVASKALGPGTSVTYTDLDGWLRAGAGAPGASVLPPAITEAELTAIDPDSVSRNPWRAINMLLAREVVVRILMGVEPADTLAFGEAKDIFLAAVAWTPGTAVRDAGAIPLDQRFRRWWIAFSDQYTQLVRNQYLMAGPEIPSRPSFGPPLAGVTVRYSLVSIVQKKNQLWESRLAAWRNRTPRPAVPVEWMDRLASRVLAAYTAGAPLVLSESDCSCLRGVLDWISTLPGYFSRYPRGARDTRLWWHVRIPGTRTLVLSRDVGIVVGEYLVLSRAWWLRDLPRSLRRDTAVQDLFFNPLKVRFARWCRKARCYGL
ncbi:hypothetical protein ACFL5Q_07700 [Planctomycetota bacterium]